MKTIWDEPKRLANIDKHRLDFADISEFGWESAIVAESPAETPNSRRFKTIG